MPAPSGLPPEPSAPPLPSGPAPTPLDLSAPLDLAAATGPTEPEPAASLADLAPAEDDELDFIGMSEDVSVDVSVDVPPFQASASQELGLDGLPLDAPPREALPDLETVEDVGAGAADSFLAPAAAVPRLDSASDEEGEWRDTDVDLDALSLSAGVAPLGAAVPPGAPAALEDAPPEEVAPSVSEAAPLPDTVRARDLVSRFVTGEDIEQVDLQWVFRLLGAAMLAGPLADDDALAAALDQVGPPP